MTKYHIRFITPLFSRSMLEDSPEIRPSSIRGQLRWWFRALGGNAIDEKAVFGGILKIAGSALFERSNSLFFSSLSKIFKALL